MARQRRLITENQGPRVSSIQLSAKRSDVSRQQDDTLSYLLDGTAQILKTPYDLKNLQKVAEQSSILRQCISAYVTNICSSGYRIVPLDEAVGIDTSEYETLKSFIDSANSEESLASINSKQVVQYETYGFSCIEVIRDGRGKVSLLRTAKSATTRILSADEKPVKVTYKMNRGGKRSTVTEYRRFRKYVQLRSGSRVYFKQFGDPRRMDYTTGRYEDVDYKVTDARLATEIMHNKQFSEDAYGIPRWIGQLPNILGSREQEEVNLRYFEDNTVPPAILAVSGGRLTKQSFTELTSQLSSASLGKDRQNKIILIEAVPEVADLDGKGDVKLDLHKLTDVRQSDGLFSQYDESNREKVRSAFRLSSVFLGLSENLTYACYDKSTETLTDQGWVTYDTWQEGMKVACVSPETGQLSYETPLTGLLTYEVEGVDMYHISTKNQDMLVTPNHRMVYALSKGGEYQISPIEKMVGHSRVYTKTSASFCGGTTPDTFDVPMSNYTTGPAFHDAPIGAIDIEDLIEWVGYFIADGCIKQNGCAITIGAKKQRKVNRLRELHDRLEDYGFRVREQQHRSGATYFTVSHKGMGSWMQTNAGKGSKSKKIPNMVWGFSPETQALLWECLVSCDGTLDSRNATTGAYSTVSPQLADDFQKLCVNLGYRAALREDRPGSYGINKTLRVLFSARESSIVEPARHISRQKYTGTVYCFSVSTGVFVTRRNGKVAIQGNTANVAAYLAEIQVFLPERKLHDEFLNKGLVNHRQGLNLKTVKLESKGPSVTNPEQIVKTLTALNVMGGVTPRASIGVINETLQLTIPQYPEPNTEGWEEWMDMPIALAIRQQGTQQTGDSANTHDAQEIKDDKIKELEEDGDISMKSPENGQQ